MKKTTSITKIILIFVFVSSVISQSKSQITSLYSNFGYQTTCVDFYDSNIGYVCGYDASSSYIRKTTNGGTAWSSSLFVTLFKDDIKYYFVKSLTANNVVLIGENTFFKEPAIFISNNGGNNWTDVSPMQYGSGLRDAYFLDSQNGYTVGNKGTVLKTIDGGKTWIDKSIATLQNFTSTYFIDINTGFAGGGSIIQKTTNGGDSWVADTISGLSVVDFVFFNANSGYLLSDNGDIYYTIDGGSNWSLGVKRGGYPQSYAMEKSPNGTVIVSENFGLCFKKTISSYWEKFSGTLTPPSSFCFINDSICYSISNYGDLKKIIINNPSLYVPVISFHTLNSVVCNNEPQQFLNDSKPEYTFKWYVDNVFQTSAYNLNYTFSTIGSHSVRLVAINSSTPSVKDSITVNYTVPGKPILNVFNVTFQDTICEDIAPIIYVNPSQYQAWYYIKDSIGKTIGIVQNGTGGTLTFPLPKIDKTASYTVIGKTATICDTVTAIKTIKITVVPLANINTVVSAVRPFVCYNDSTYINVYNSEPGIMYRLKKDNLLISDSLQGNGATLQFPTHTIYSLNVFSIVARNSRSCMRQFPDITVKVSNVSADYEPINQNLFVGDTLKINTSLVIGDSLKWIFNPDAALYNDTSHNPLVSFSATGIKSSLLTIKTQYGCIDSVRKNIYVYTSAPTDNSSFCLVKDLPFRSEYLNDTTKYNEVFDITVDKDKNTYLTGFTATKGGDSFFFDGGAYILKCDSNMNTQWEKKFYTSWSSCKSVLASCIITDKSGDVFLGGKYFCDYLVMDTISLRSNKNLGEMFIAKYTPNGNAKWIIRGKIINSSTQLVSGGPSSFTIDDAGYIYCSIARGAYDQLQLIFPDGSTYTSSTTANEILIIKIDPLTGKLIRTSSITANGKIGGEYQISNSAWYTYRSFPLNPKIKYTPNGKIYLIGTTYSKLTVGRFSVDTIMNGNKSATFFAAFADTSLNWENAFPLAAYTYGAHNWVDMEFKKDMAPAYDVDSSGNLYFSFRWNRSSNDARIMPSVRLNGKSYFTYGNFLTKFNSSGSLVWANLNENPFLSVKGIFWDNKNRLILAGHFRGFFGYSSSSGLSLGQKAFGGRDMFVAQINSDNGDLNWCRKYGSPLGDESINNIFKPTASSDIYMSGNIVYGSDFSMDGSLMHNTMNNIIVGKFNRNSNCLPNVTPDTTCLNCPPPDTTTGLVWKPLSINTSTVNLQATYINNHISIAISLEHASMINLSVYDMLGNKITTLVNNNRLPEGEHMIEYSSGLSAGMYFVKMDVRDHFSLIKKVVVLY